MELEISKNFVAENGENINLVYKVIYNNGYDIVVTSKEETTSETVTAKSRAKSENEAIKLVSLLADNFVTPVTVVDVLEDYEKA